MKPDLLVINTYGGSLLLAAKQAGLLERVRGTYEDVGYGSDVQAANFPGIHVIPQRKDWPKDDLSKTVVIAHPPCAAFSGLTMGRAANQGVDTKKFACTVDVLKYATDLRAAAVLVESVRPAMQGAWFVHDSFKEKGYVLYRLIQNSQDFGVAQNRPRFWVIYIREDLAASRWFVKYEPTHQNVGDILTKDAREPFEAVQRVFDSQKKKILDGGLSVSRFNAVLKDKDGGQFFAIAGRRYFPDEDLRELKERFMGGIFMAMVMRVLSEDKPATTLLGNGVWVSRGRLLNQVEYKRIMGFPDGYVFPGKTIKRATFYLSQGIVPAVGAWLLREVLQVLDKPRASGLLLRPHEPQDIRSEKLEQPELPL